MTKSTLLHRARSDSSTGQFTFSIESGEYRSLPLPGLDSQKAKLGECFVRVTDLPEDLDSWMEVNPRVPKRSQKNVLSGPVIKGILSTLRDNPDDMVLKNQGIYLLVANAHHEKKPGGKGQVTINLTDPKMHGIVNGGHTYAAIREAINQADEAEEKCLGEAYVRLHVLQGLPAEKVPDIAEGLNRSKQVDDPSLENLRDNFEKIKQIMKGRPGEKDIAYSQGQNGDIYITEILVFLEMFNPERFVGSKHPNGLYSSKASALRYFSQDAKADPELLDAMITLLPDILQLTDKIREKTPKAAKNVGFEFGLMKDEKGRRRTGSKEHKNTPLPFINKKMNHRVPNGWLFPMLAAFRANMKWDKSKCSLEWKVPYDEVLEAVIDDLVEVCVSEHKDNNMRPELIGKRESAYRQCLDKVLLFLAKRGRLE